MMGESGDVFGALSVWLGNGRVLSFADCHPNACIFDPPVAPMNSENVAAAPVRLTMRICVRSA